MKNELVLFETADKEIKLNGSVNNNTVWLNRNQISEFISVLVEKSLDVHIRR